MLSVHISFVLSGDFTLLQDSVSTQEIWRTFTYFVFFSIASRPLMDTQLLLSFSFSLSLLQLYRSHWVWNWESTSHRGASTGHKGGRNEAVLFLGGSVELWMLFGQALNTVPPNTHTRQVSEQVGWPRAHAGRDTWEVGGYNYTFIKVSAGLSPLQWLSYGC